MSVVSGRVDCPRDSAGCGNERDSQEYNLKALTWDFRSTIITAKISDVFCLISSSLKGIHKTGKPSREAAEESLPNLPRLKFPCVNE